MPKLHSFISLALALSSLPNSFAGPACAKRHYQAADCVETCKSRWGWSGAIMGTDPWGSVIKNVDPAKALEDAIKEACGTTVPVASSSPTFTLSSVIQQPTSMVISQTESVTSVVVVPTSSIATTSSSSTIVNSTSVAASSTSSIVVPSSTSTSITSSSVVPTAPSFFAPVQGFVNSITSSSSQRTARPITTTTRRANPTTTTTRRANPTTTSRAESVANTANSNANNTPASSGGSTSSADIQAYLSAHNTIRAQHGAAPLTWSNDLADKAQQWANGCQFEHSGGSLGPLGENLAAGTGSSYGIAAAVKSWTDEVSDYNPNNPQPSHFTQVVWKATTQVGCAVQSCNGIFDAKFGPAKYFVCEYSPQGNIIGRFGDNVQV
ncbi:hypothetical protein CVT24_012629 [Panaeolus cyanescens]|uniref:SCP domain-containing protein n=1 Tax=Panaeolus cyanescens TaxID=181874 RepID=A0A409WD11_9AGAR|nr:hypothetical protein CVT24_012629 [Panaeolus cyanescens]